MSVQRWKEMLGGIFRGQRKEVELEVPFGLRTEIYEDFQKLGEIQADGRSFLKEVTVNIERFRVVIRTNESQHRGRPHCLIQMGEDSGTFDIVTGKLLAGDLKSWTRTAEKVVASHSSQLLDLWTATRPDDQKLKH